LYYERKAPATEDVELLNLIRDIWLRLPFYGYRRITKELKASGIKVNGKRVQRLMKEGGIQAIYPGPNTSKRNKLHAVYPYLLKDLDITKPNQVWQVDITYLRMGNGFMYLVALIDVYSRFVVGWSLSNTLDTPFCIDALKSGLCVAKPDIVNSDQGCQFTSGDWVDALNSHEIKISMTGKGRCIDNIYIERFWRSFKREEFYLNDYGSVPLLKKAIKNYIEFYNYRRWHQSLDYKTPAEVYCSATNKEMPVDMWTSPSDQPAPFGTCGQAMDNANALPTT
jgi:putative transposase